MRFIAAIMVALVLGACGPQTQRDASAGCARQAEHAVTWSNADAPDLVTARADGPTCAQAVVLLVVRNAHGDPLWSFASTYYDLTVGGVAPEGAEPVAPDAVDTFLAAWANVTTGRTSALPEWRGGTTRPGEDVAPFGYESPFDRDTYEAMRARDLPTICYAAAVEATQCLIIDPASNAPAMIVAYGP